MFKVTKSLSIVCNGVRRNSTYLPIGEFYAGRSVLITGGTGFVGKVLLEKLLYHCNQIEKVYLIIRDNEKMKSSERLNTMLKLPLFRRLREEQPEQFKKLVPVCGDIAHPGLGLKPKDADAMKHEVSVVFHSAASVKFKDTLSNLVQHNTKGTQHIVDFSTTIKNLKVFVHVSSAYSQSDKKYIEEKIYLPAITLNEVNKVASSTNQDDEAAILNGKTNTYTLTKALAEDIVVEANHKNDLPAIIIRPSIISPVYKDCLPGWIDNWFGATSILTTTSKGLCHVIRGRKTNILDLIPVDYVASVMIVSAAKYTRDSVTVPVYNVCSSSANPLTFNEIRKHIIICSRQQKFNVLPVGFIITESNYLFQLSRFWSESVPGFVIDLREKLCKRKPWYRQVLRQIKDQREVLDAFSNNSWIMTSSNTEHLAFNFSPEDRIRYQLDPKEIVWDEYISLYLKGISHYMLKKHKMI